MDAIRDALNEYKIPNTWWPVPLVDTVQKVDIALAIPWIANCILELLTRERHDSAALIADRVRRAVATDSPGEVKGMLDEYDSVLHPLRDNLLLSYRHLIQAKQFLMSDRIIELRTQLVWALLYLGDCEYSRRNNIQFVIDDFLRMLSKPPSDPHG
jgi:hypothetical protein